MTVALIHWITAADIENNLQKLESYMIILKQDHSLVGKQEKYAF